MPAAEDGEWSNWCSNVVCVRTKSSKDAENNSEGQVVHVQPIVIKSVYRNEASPSIPARIAQRRRITRLIQSQQNLTSDLPPVPYEGINRVSLNLKVPDVTEYSLPPMPPPRRSPVRLVLQRPTFEPKLDRYIPDYSHSSSSASRSNFQPIRLPSSTRASSLPPLFSTTRRSSIAVPSFSATSGYSGRPVGDIRSLTSGYTGRPITDVGSSTSKLRRGSIDVSYLSRGHDYNKGSSCLRSSVPPLRSDSDLRNTYRRGSLSSTGTGFQDRPTYRSRTVTRFTEDEIKSSTPETLASLRTRTEHARDKLDTHRTLLDRYLTGPGSREPSVDSRFAHLADSRKTDLDSYRRASIATLPRRLSVTGSRAPSIERNDLRSSLPRQTPPPPSMSNMSPARRRIRNVLYKVSGNEEFLG